MRRYGVDTACLKRVEDWGILDRVMGWYKNDLWWRVYDREGCLVFDVWYDVWYMMYDVWCMMYDVRCLMFDVWCLMFRCLWHTNTVLIRKVQRGDETGEEILTFWQVVKVRQHGRKWMAFLAFWWRRILCCPLFGLSMKLFMRRYNLHTTPRPHTTPWYIHHVICEGTGWWSGIGKWLMNVPCR